MAFNEERFAKLIKDIEDENFVGDRLDLMSWDLSDEHVFTLLAAIESNPALKERLALIDLRYNRLENLSQCALINFPSLQVLLLSKNSLTQMLVIENCDSMKILDISNNLLTKYNLPNLPALEELHIQDNNLKRNPNVEAHPKLELLSLVRNNITEYDDYPNYRRIPKLYLKEGNKLDSSLLGGLEAGRAMIFARYKPTPRADFSEYLPGTHLPHQQSTKFDLF